jgi:thiol:disulfide interchange protein
MLGRRSRTMSPRALVVFALSLCALGVAGCSAEPPKPLPPLAWEVVRDVDDLERAMALAKERGKPVVVELTSAGCAPCRMLERYVDQTPAVRERFEGMARLRIDASSRDRPELRAAVGILDGRTPQMVFFRKDGERLKEHLLGFDVRRLEAALSRAF